MKNPHEILGVPKNATEEQIKTAYHELARKYHPDNFSDSTMKELANEKMREINEAYDILSRRGSSDYTSSVFADIRRLINNGNYSEAEIKLDSINASDRNAEWNFLKGCLFSQRGWYLEAQKYFEYACSMDPSNREYRQAHDSMRNTAYNYSQGYNQAPPQRTNSSSSCDTDCCTKLICLDCLCECMGGDLIACC